MGIFGKPLSKIKAEKAYIELYKLLLSQELVTVLIPESEPLPKANKILYLKKTGKIIEYSMVAPLGAHMEGSIDENELAPTINEPFDEAESKRLVPKILTILSNRLLQEGCRVLGEDCGFLENCDVGGWEFTGRQIWNKTTGALQSFKKINTGQYSAFSITSGGSNLLMDLAETTRLLIDDERPYQIENKLNALLTLFGGLQSFAFGSAQMYLPFVAGTIFMSGAISASILTFILSVKGAIELHHARVENSFSGWLENSLRQLKRYDKLLSHFAEILKTLEQADLKKNRIHYLQLRIARINMKKAALISDIEARCCVESYPTAHPEADITSRDEINEIAEKVYGKNWEQTVSFNFSKNPKQEEIANRTEFNCTAPATQTQKDRVADIILAKQQTYSDKKWELAAMISLFVGFTLLAFAPLCPPLIFVGGVFVALGGGYFLGKAAAGISKPFGLFAMDSASKLVNKAKGKPINKAISEEKNALLDPVEPNYPKLAGSRA